MDKLGLIPILSIIIIGSLSLVIFADIQGLFENQDSAMTISNINLSSEKYPPSIATLTITADAIFHEDIESISMKGKAYMSDGSYKGVNFNGNPKNGLQNQTYQLNYSDGGLYLNHYDLNNMDYIELTITTVNKEGISKEMNLNVSSGGQVDTNSSDVIGNSSADNICPICGKETGLDPTVHADGTTHSDSEWEKWYEDNGYEIYSDSDSKTNKNNNNNKKTPNEEPLPPSDYYDSGSDGSGGLYGLLINLFKNYR